MTTPSLRIAVVSPSGAHDPARLEKGMALVRSWGHEVVAGPSLGSRAGYFAGTVEERTSDLVWALTAPDIDLVWFARGGYGTVHTLAGIDWAALDGRPVVGFSDATALFTAMWRMGAQGAVHGPVAHALAHVNDEDTQGAVRRFFGGRHTAHLHGRPFCGPETAVSAPVVGGNLTVLASLAGTPWSLKAEGAIVLLEEVGEAPYRVHRSLVQLRDSGGLDGLLGVALGEFSGCQGSDPHWGLREALLDVLLPLGVPVVDGLPVGHAARNHPWCHGAVAILDPEGLHVGAH